MTSRLAPPISPPAARASFAADRDVDAFVEALRRFENGELDAEGWRAYRIARGVYPQRQGDSVHMLRVKIPQGVASADQLRAFADVARRWSRGYGHVTTRQDLQLHFVRQEHLAPALRRLSEAGVTTVGACGNAVRNVVACHHAGVAPDEAFDVTPYAEAVSRWFLHHPRALLLPRKFKIAFEGCAEDHVTLPIHDIGFRARVRSEAGRTVRGFSVTVAGGTATLCAAGAPLIDFLPAGEALALAEAIVRVFDARGDRANRKRNRLKFLVRQLGLDAFRALLDGERARIAREGAPRLPFDPDRPPVEAPPAHPRPPAPTAEAIAARVTGALLGGPGEPPRIDATVRPAPGALEGFRRTNVRRQRQEAFSSVLVSLPQGDVSAEQLEALAALALSYGDGTVRFTNRGHATLRWIHDDEVGALHARLSAAGLARDGAGSAADVVACPGADSCRLAVTRTRGIARVIEDEVRSALGAAALSTALPVHVSGCPNGCSQHHVAAIGLQGSVRRLGTRVVPQYFVLVGGGAAGGSVGFGQLAARIPAGRVPAAVRALVALYLEARRGGESAGAFFARSLDAARGVLAPFQQLLLEGAREEELVEPGSSGPFRPGANDGDFAA